MPAWDCTSVELSIAFSSQTHLIWSYTWHAFPPLSGGLEVLFGISAWAVTCGLKTELEIVAHSHKPLMLAYTDGMLNSTQILPPESHEDKNQL